jgi:hypothetical protein
VTRFSRFEARIGRTLTAPGQAAWPLSGTPREVEQLVSLGAGTHTETALQ